MSEIIFNKEETEAREKFQCLLPWERKRVMESLLTEFFNPDDFYNEPTVYEFVRDHDDDDILDEMPEWEITWYAINHCGDIFKECLEAMDGFEIGMGVYEDKIGDLLRGLIKRHPEKMRELLGSIFMEGVKDV